MDYTKSVVEPMKQVAPRSRLRGMVEDYRDIDTDVLVLAGETHLNRKPVRKILTSEIHDLINASYRVACGLPPSQSVMSLLILCFTICVLPALCVV